MPRKITRKCRKQPAAKVNQTCIASIRQAILREAENFCSSIEISPASPRADLPANSSTPDLETSLAISILPNSDQTPARLTRTKRTTELKKKLKDLATAVEQFATSPRVERIVTNTANSLATAAITAAIPVIIETVVPAITHCV